MSHLFGFFNRNTEPAQPAVLEQMATALGPAGEAGLTTRHHLALGVRLLAVTPEDRFETQPLWQDGLLLVGHIRLDNRDELQQALRLPAPDTQPDSAFVIAAWRRWGADALDRLLGDWVFALWDERDQSLLLARDSNGNVGLYWWHSDKLLVFGSSLHAVLAHPAVPHEPDELTIACLLTSFLDPEVADATCYRGVRRLPPGRCIRLSERSLQTDTWWRPEQLGELAYPRADDYFDAFRAVYQQAVASRLRCAPDDRVGLLLSAGLDSSSVMAMAAPLLARRGRVLHAYTHRPLHLPDGLRPWLIADEYELAHQSALHVGNVEHRGFQHEQVSWLDALERSVLLHGEPTLAGSSSYWIHDLLGIAAGEGVRVMLTGQGGNSTVSWTGTGNLWPALARGHLAQAWRELANSRMTLSKALRVQLASPVRQALRRRMLGRRLRHQTDQALQTSVLRPELVQRLRLIERMQAQAFDLSGQVRPTQAQNLQFRLYTHSGGLHGNRWLEIGNAFGLAVLDPTRDRRVVEFCARVPDAVFWDGGAQRALIRRGLAGRLPQQLLQKQRYGIQSTDISTRIHKEIPRLVDKISSTGLASVADQWINPQALLHTLGQASADTSLDNFMQIVPAVTKALGVMIFADRLIRN